MLLFRNIALSTLFLFICFTKSHATTVLSVDVDYLLEHSDLVFEGKVTSKESRWNTEKSSISTYVEFQITDTIKGSNPTHTLTLHFAGGSVGDIRLEIAAMNYPNIGEQGIYFVQTGSDKFINPLIGWSQGHFLMQEDSSGDMRVMTYDNSPVMSVETETTPDDMHLNEEHLIKDTDIHHEPFSHGTAQGLRLGKVKNRMQDAMKVNDFKSSLRTKLKSIKNASSTHQ